MMVLYYYYVKHAGIPCTPIEASTGPTRVDAPENEGRAIPRNVVVYKKVDDGESPKFKK
jgi:hypothetical protein